MRTSDSGPPNHRNLMQQIQKTIVFHSFFKKLGVPMPIGRSRLLLGVLGYGLGVPDSYWAFSAMDWAFPRRLFEETIRGDYPKETIRRRLFEETIRRRLFEGVAHTIFFGVVPELGT